MRSLGAYLTVVFVEMLLVLITKIFEIIVCYSSLNFPGGSALINVGDQVLTHNTETVWSPSMKTGTGFSDDMQGWF